MCGTRSRLPSWPDSLCPLVQDPSSLPLGCACSHRRPWQKPTGQPQQPRPLPLPLLGLGFPNQVKGLVNIFRTRDSALRSLRVTQVKFSTSIPTSISIPNPFSTSPSHPEPLVRPRSCNVDLSLWVGLGSAAQTLAPHSWLATPASPERKVNEFGCKDFLSHPHPCWGSRADPAVVARAAGSWLVPPRRVGGMPAVPGPGRAWEHPITNKLLP